MEKRECGSVRLLPPTSITRAVWFRWDEFGVYLWLEENGHMAGCASLQYGKYLTPHHVRGFSFTNSLPILGYDEGGWPVPHPAADRWLW